jgi:type VI protein secretion system component Hcp
VNFLKRAAVLVIPAAIAIGAGSAIAASDDSALIRACASPDGMLRLAGSDGLCPRGESPVNWHQEGPAGPQGVPGPVGPTPLNVVGGDPLAGGQAEGSVKLDGIPGESANAEIAVMSFAFGVKNLGGGGKAQFGNLRFAKLYDAASPKLMLRTASGRRIPLVTFTFRHREQPGSFLTYTLTDVRVAGYEQGGDKERPLLEHVELNFSRVQVTYQPANGAPPVTAGWDLKGNVSV